MGQMGDTGRRVLASLFVFALVFTALPGTSWTALTDPDLAPGDYALIQVTPGTADAIAAKATAAGATDVASLDTIDMVTARVSADTIRALQNDSRVAVLASDGIVSAAGKKERYERGNPRPSPGVEVVDAKEAWREATGRGVTVVLMDTGIAEHPDLAGSVIARLDFVNDGSAVLDPSGHGTFMAGLIAAHGRTFKGVAPDAKLISLRVLDQDGYGKMRSVLAAFNWVLHNRTTSHIEVLNLSFGAPQRSSYHRSLLAGVVESAWLAGVTVVAAAGNDGPSSGTVAMPGADPFVITVGSLDDQGTLATNDDRESLFSSRGPTRDGFAKPDVLAPGEHVVSLRVPGTALDRDERGYSRNQGNDMDLPTGPYARLTGTSASTAMAAGAAAVLLQAHRRYSPTQVKGALIAGGRRIAGTRTPGLDVDDSLTARPARVNAGLAPSLVLLRLLAESGNALPDIAWDGISWEGISWESISWEGVAWESVSWEGVTWDGVTWDGVTWDLR